MSSCYTLEHIIEECNSEKSATNRVGTTQGARFEVFVESWTALNQWIESRLRKRRGASISMFGSFTWEFKRSDGGNIDFRPIFIVADSFAKQHQVRRQRIHQFPVLAPNEEVNFSALAIKFSKSLTKDMVFSGVRDIMKKIGDYVDRVYEFEIEFSFGTLRSKERKIKFEFNQSRLDEILPENMSGLYMPEAMAFQKQSEGANKETSNSVDRSKYSVPRFEKSNSTQSMLESVPSDLDSTHWNETQSMPSTKSFSVPTLQPNYSTLPQDPHNSPESTQSAREHTGWPDTGIGLDTSYVAQSPIDDYPSNRNDDAPLSPRLQQILLSLDQASPSHSHAASNRRERGKFARERVIEQAYVKCLKDTEAQAQYDDDLNAKFDQLHQKWVKNEQRKREDKHNEAKSLKNTLDWQLEETHKRGVQESEERRNAKISFILPATAGAQKRPTEELIRDLSQQIKSNADRKARVRVQTMQEEKEYLDHIAMELDMQSAVDRANHLEKQQALLEAWERDGHIRNLKRLQVCGAAAIKTYIEGNLPDAAGTLNSSSKSAMTGMSVGFDPRRSSRGKY